MDLNLPLAVSPRSGYVELESYPNFIPETYEEVSPEWYTCKKYGPGGLPRIQPKPNSKVLGLDYYVNCKTDEFFVKCWEKKDHPNLEVLLRDYPNCPRIVKSLYRQDFQLRILRSLQYNFGYFLEVNEAWDNYIEQKQ